MKYRSQNKPDTAFRFLQTWPALLLSAFLLTAFLIANGVVLVSFLTKSNAGISWENNLFRFDISAFGYDFSFMGDATFTPTATTQLLTSTSTSTPFQPINPTVTPTFTLTPTFTPTFTFTPSAIPATPTPPPPTPTEVVWPPLQAKISNVPGHGMRYSLDCETRSAVDLAKFFGYEINHDEFLNNLPYTDDPETGYVGSYRDPAGNIPPYSYGVHSPPIGDQLRSYGVPAADWKDYSFESLKEEIASGRPVMVWVISSVVNGTPVEYTAESTGNTTTVAAYEHTVLVIGYDENYVYIQDGWDSYRKSTNQFLRSWGVLKNMAVTIAP